MGLFIFVYSFVSLGEMESIIASKILPVMVSYALRDEVDY